MIEKPIVWNDILYQPLFPIGEPSDEIFPANFAFTPRQRAWYSRVYSGVCHFPKFTDDGQIYHCGSDQNIEVHHIQPDGWTRAQEPWQDPNDTMGIALCRAHHNGVIHPDIQEARDNYRQDQQSFTKAITKHREYAALGKVFWNDEWDVMLRAIAEGAVERYMTGNPGDLYPVDVSWGKRDHPKEKKWYDNLF